MKTCKVKKEIDNEENEKFVKLYGRYLDMKRRMDNPELMHEGDILAM